MSVHPILAAHEAWSGWDKRGKDLQRQRDSLAKQQMALQEAEAAAVRAHEQRVREAVEKSRPVPPAPEKADFGPLDKAWEYLRAGEQAHFDDRDRVLARVWEEGGEQAIRDRLRAGLEKIAAVAPEVLAAKADVEATLVLYRDVLTALDRLAGSTVHPDRASRLRVGLTVEEVLDASPDSLLTLTPLQPGQNPILPVDPDEQRRATIREHNRRLQEEIVRSEEGKRLGLTVHEDRVGVFGNQRLAQPPTVERQRPGEI